MRIFDATLAGLERSLDVRLVRHNVLAGNLANVDTPGYAPKDVDFASAMASVSSNSGPSSPSLQRTQDRHLSVQGGPGASGAGEIPIRDVSGAAPALDGNRVDLDRTMVQLAENGMQYGAGARAASKKLAILRYVASDGNG